MLTVLGWEKKALEKPGRFHRNRHPDLSNPEEAVKTYMYMYRYRRNLDLLYQTPEDLPVDLSHRRATLSL